MNGPGITKVFLAGHDWPALAAEMSGQLSTLIEQRLGYKMAASPLFSKKDLDEHAPPPGHFMRHQIVMGDQEKFGFNINADGYPSDALQKYHHTFVTNGHVFREHHNQHPKHAIGRIKAARYSPQLGRVETLEHLEIAKAEKEYEMAKAGKASCASQACHVPFDVCNACGQKAKYASNYCDDLKYRPKQYIAGQKKYAFAVNPITKFFDSSVVANPAAREARHIAFRFADSEQRAKAASSGSYVLTGADRAEADSLHLDTREELPYNLSATLSKLASLERGEAEAGLQKLASVSFFGRHNLTDVDVGSMSKLLPRTLFSKLANSGSWLPLDVFTSYITGQSLVSVRSSQQYKEACACLPSMFGELEKSINTGTCEGLPDLSLFEPCERSHEAFDPAAGDEVDQVLQSVERDCSIHEAPLKSRSISITIKTASVIVPGAQNGSKLAESYALYKLASCAHMIARGANPVIVALSAVQNHQALA